MSTQASISENELVEIPSPHVEPRIACQSQPPRQVSNNLTLIDGKTFLSTTLAGDIVPAIAPDVGFFHDDTRFLSHLELCVGGHQTLVLSSNTEKNFLSQIELTTGHITLRDSYDLAENTIHIRRQQLLNGKVMFDRLVFLNFNLSPVDLSVEFFLNADFVDVFQVRGVSRTVHGQYYRPVVRGDSLAFFYRGLDGVLRKTLIEMNPLPSYLDESTARWELQLAPLTQTDIKLTVTPVIGESNTSLGFDFTDSLRQRRDRYSQWQSHSTRFRSNSGIFNAALNNAISDFHALLIRDGEQSVVAAGIPWFATIFGRDSIIASYQTLSLNPQLAIDTLRVLARYQGTEYSDWRDEEPGKILHEYRHGEMTRAGELPFGPYYGSIDATPLFLILLSETYNWTADEALVRELLPSAYRALDWIDRYGDLDGDGLVEYSRRSPKGLSNQGWKDSWDAYMRPDGTIPPSPIAPVEVQGYVYDAKYRMASLLRSFGNPQRAEQLEKEAAEIAQRLEKVYWSPQRSFYAMALDGEKKSIDVVASNPGHLLFSRVVGKERACTLVNRMMEEDMFTGWGWRTLSQREAIFNPLSYHRGSVWPHDNSLIAHGMALSEFRRPAANVLTALFQASLSFREYRLPELFCGVQRRDHDEPVHYPVSCSPQAWASGAWFLILTSILGIRPSAQRKELNIVNPELPEWLEYLRIRSLRIGGSRVGLDFTRRHARTFCNVVDVEGEDLAVNLAFKK